MIEYQRILIGVELHPNSDELLIQKAQQLRAHSQADIFLLHVVENITNYGAAYGVVIGVDIEQALKEEAEKNLQQIGEKLGVPDQHQLVRVGAPGRILLQEAEENQADLIVVGSHGRHGIRLLLGSTANSILHGAKCDVLAVRLKD